VTTWCKDQTTWCKDATRPPGAKTRPPGAKTLSDCPPTWCKDATRPPGAKTVPSRTCQAALQYAQREPCRGKGRYDEGKSHYMSMLLQQCYYMSMLLQQCYYMSLLLHVNAVTTSGARPCHACKLFPDLKFSNSQCKFMLPHFTVKEDFYGTLCRSAPFLPFW